MNVPAMLHQSGAPLWPIDLPSSRIAMDPHQRAQLLKLLEWICAVITIAGKVNSCSRWNLWHYMQDSNLWDDRLASYMVAAAFIAKWKRLFYCYQKPLNESVASTSVCLYVGIIK